MRTVPLAVAALVAATLTLSACGSDDDTSTPASSSTDQAATFDPSTVAKDDAIAALVPADLAKSGKLVVGTDTTYAPAEYIDEDGTTPVGYDVDLIKAVAAVLGLEADVRTADFTGIIPAIGATYDVGISSFTINPERLEQVHLVQYFSAGEAYAVAAGNPKKVAADDLCGLTIGVQTGTVEDDELPGIADDCKAAGKPEPKPLRYAKQSDVTTALVGGKADVMYADSPIVAYAIAQTSGRLEQLGEVFATAPQGIAVAKKDDQLTQAVAQAVQKLIDDGTYGKILDAWGNADGAVTTAEIDPAVD